MRCRLPRGWWWRSVLCEVRVAQVVFKPCRNICVGHMSPEILMVGRIRLPIMLQLKSCVAWIAA